MLGVRGDGVLRQFGAREPGTEPDPRYEDVVEGRDELGVRDPDPEPDPHEEEVLDVPDDGVLRELGAREPDAEPDPQEDVLDVLDGD